MNRAQQNSVMRMSQAIQLIEKLAPQEQKREAIQRRRKMEKAYKSLTLHGKNLNIEVPELSTFYYPEQYLSYARLVGSRLLEKQKTLKQSYESSVRQLSLWNAQTSEARV
jgi:hypothetical protein